MIIGHVLRNRVRCLSSGPKIPLIDFGRFHKNNAHDREILAKEIDEACTEIGFFAIVNHGVDDHTISDAWSKTQEFFDLPAEKKLKASPSMTSDYPYGYIPLGGEKLAAGRDAEVGKDDEATEAPPDLNESFSVGPERTNSNDAPMRQWPSHDPAFVDAWTNYYASLETLSASLLETFAIALKLPSSKWFENKIDHHRCASSDTDPVNTSPTGIPKRAGSSAAA